MHTWHRCLWSHIEPECWSEGKVSTRIDVIRVAEEYILAIESTIYTSRELSIIEVPRELEWSASIVLYTIYRIPDISLPLSGVSCIVANWSRWVFRRRACKFSDPMQTLTPLWHRHRVFVETSLSNHVSEHCRNFSLAWGEITAVFIEGSFTTKHWEFTHSL